MYVINTKNLKFKTLSQVQLKNSYASTYQMDTKNKILSNTKPLITFLSLIRLKIFNLLYNQWRKDEF